MKTIRKRDQNLKELMDNLKVGDYPIFDECSSYEITRVPGGFIYRNEYSGLCFVPECRCETGIKNSVAKTEPKETKRKLPKVVTK